MKIALNGLFLNRPDGTGRYCRELLRASARLETDGRSPIAPAWHLIGLRGDEPGRPLEPLPRRVDCDWLTPPPWIRGENAAKLWFEQGGLPAHARALGVDLLHYPYFAAPLRPPAPLVVTIHDLIPLVLREYRGTPLVRAYMSLQSVAARRARVILADSHASRHDIVRLLSVPRHRVRVVPLGVDPEFRPAPATEVAAVRARYHLPERYVLYSGGLDVRKNVERLVLAYARARVGHGVTEPLVITGDASRRGALHRPLPPLIERLGLGEHVRLPGLVPDAELPALYTGATLFVYPSRYEGFGLPVLQAMACGTPVACSRGGSLIEVAGEAALTFAPDDEPGLAAALVRGLQDEPLRQRLRGAGLDRAAAFTWEKTAAATLQAYADAVAAV
ncbi:MAG TPA: glycosyltransferase family 1 protein [Chloroflexota bacterium]|jgi:glycosyltransferase involved in cell wall biosynthesis